MHTECAGLDKVPKGKWFCPEHASFQGKVSKPRPSSAKPSGSLDADYGAKPKSELGSKAGKVQHADALASSKSSDSDDADYGAKPKSKSGSKAGKAQQAKAAALRESSESADAGDTVKPKSKSGSKAGKAQPASASAGKALDNVDNDSGAKSKSKSGSKVGKGQAAGDLPGKSKADLKAVGNSKARKAQEDPAVSAAPSKGSLQVQTGSKAGKSRSADGPPAGLVRTNSKTKQTSSKAGTTLIEEELHIDDKPAKKRKTSGEDAAGASNKPKSSKAIDAANKQSASVPRPHSGE